MTYEYLHLRQGKDVYTLCVHGKYNFIVGPSGTGKSFLREVLLRRRANRPTSYSGFAPLMRYSEFTSLLAGGNPDPNAIVYIDELDINDDSWNNIADIMRRSNSWFIISKRDLPSDLPYGVHDIFKIQRNGYAKAMVPYYSFDLFNHVGKA